ncbi:squalene/phytoene synthase family protein [Streptomyces sp. MMG1121]|uniref:squalene/phytoene synthase family protein n=1 Tax=Streptomyces sp. MMG1121 TaxID=1415544 RepID=UPI0006AE0168|nr:squalene/phytoene synthase family protein [Streptomyces sp. MMG1121]KOV69390.1 phytoene/squalene synthetase [Streptomyces sp. MMG1121]
MNAWTKSLDAAGVSEPRLRADYGSQRRLVRRFRRTAYLAARLLLPRAVLPHVVAMTAVMHHGDNLLDTGPMERRAAAWASWERQVREALSTGAGEESLIRVLAHTVAARPRLRGTVEDYLSTATAELDFAGFATEAAYQEYVDAYAFPAFMLVADLLGPEADDRRHRAACRVFIDGSQRLDFVNDLAEDLREGHVGIPVDTLDRFALTVDDLAAGRGGPALDALVAHEVAAARASLRAARELPALTPAPYRRLVRALVEIELLTADAVEARGAGVLRGAASPAPVGTLRVLARRN